ncbi:MAG: YfhO family protein [Candidatus Obscuribacterales bacterium]|nr:YfhO family protein [Candidatus Obscuribacterales bacterium]
MDKYSSKRLLFGLFFVHLFVLVVLYWPAVSGQAEFYFEDITHFFEPHCRFIGQALRRGEFPLWNPLSYCGMPQIAVSSPGIFFPFNWLFACLPFSMALAWIMIVHQLIAGVAGYLYARFLKLPILSCVFVGSTLCLSGYLFGCQSNFTLCCTAAWLCLSFCAFAYLIDAVALPEILFWNGVAILSVTMTVAAGRPEIFAPGFILLFLQSLFLSAKRWSIFCGQLRVFFIGLLFAMPVILPSLEWIPWSRRAEGLFAGEVLLYSANWYDFLSLFLFQPLGDLQKVDAPFLGLTLPMKYMPYLSSAYIGPFVCTLALWGVSARSRLALMLTLLLLIVLVVSAGLNVPGATVVVESLRLFSFLRFSVKFLFFAVAIIALLAAIGASEFLSGRTRFSFAFVFWGILFWLGVILAVSGNKVILPFETGFVGQGQREIGQQVVAQSLLFTSLFGLLLNAGAKFALAKLAWRQLVLCGFFVLSMALFMFNAQLGSLKFASNKFFSYPSSLVQSIENGRLMTFYMESFFRPKQFVQENQPTADLYQYDRQVLFPNSNYDFAIPHIYGFEGAMVGEYFYYLTNVFIKSNLSLPGKQVAHFVQSIKSKAENPDFGLKSDLALYRFLQTCSCQYITTQQNSLSSDGNSTSLKLLDSRFFTMTKEIDSLNLRLYSIKDPLPRVSLMYNFKIFSNRDHLIDTMFFPERSGFAPKQACLLEANPGFAPSESAPGAYRLKIKDLSCQHIQIEAVTEKAAVLVLADQYYPGWKVFVDGSEQQLLRTNGFFRGVALSQGQHEINFVYEPQSLKNAFILLVCGLLWLALWLYQLFNKKTDDDPLLSAS